MIDGLLQKYIKSKIDENIYCRVNGKFKLHLRDYNLTYQQYYERYITGIKEFCPFCGKPKKFYQTDHTYADTCGDPICVGKQGSLVKQNFTDDQWAHQREEYRKTMSSKTEEELEVINKQRRTTLKQIQENGLIGIENMIINIAKTKEERHGDPKYNNSVQISITKQERTPEENNKSNKQREVTMLATYGYSNNFIRPEVIKKARKAKIKQYILPSGNIVNLRGYEPKALDILLKTFDEIEIIINDCIDIEEIKRLIFKYKRVSRHRSSYCPDFYIPSKKLLIEVKSQWWFDGHGKRRYKSRLENNKRKRQACLDSGYNFEFWVWNDEQEEFDII